MPDSVIENPGEFIFPIILCKKNDSEVGIEFTSFLGTGFFIGNEGFFLTAKHIIVQPEGEIICCIVKSQKPHDLHTITSHTMPITSLIVHEKEDIAVGYLKYKHYKNNDIFYSFNDNECAIFDNIRSFGYPQTLQTNLKDFLAIGMGIKGYIHRIFEEKYLISCPIPPGMSGSPVFGEKSDIIGICVATIESQCENHQVLEFKDNEIHYVEKISKVSQYGLVLRLCDLKDWEIEIANNRKLSELF